MDLQLPTRSYRVRHHTHTHTHHTRTHTQHAHTHTLHTHIHTHTHALGLMLANSCIRTVPQLTHPAPPSWKAHKHNHELVQPCAGALCCQKWWRTAAHSALSCLFQVYASSASSRRSQRRARRTRWCSCSTRATAACVSGAASRYVTTSRCRVTSRHVTSRHEVSPRQHMI